MNWTLERAAAFVAKLIEPAHAAGWMVGVYGSTLVGGGRDLDLLCVPWRPSADRLGFEAVLQGKEIDRHLSAWDTSFGVAYHLPDGSIVDVLYVERIDVRMIAR